MKKALRWMNAVAAFAAFLLSVYGMGWVFANIVFSPPTTPTCDGRAMSPGDLCQQMQGGTVMTTDNYQERLETDMVGYNIYCYSGGALVVVCLLVLGAVIVDKVRNRKNRRAAN